MNDLPIVIFYLRNLRQRIDRIFHGYPDQAIPFNTIVVLHPRFTRNIFIFSLRNKGTSSALVITPAMVWANDAIITHMTQRKRSTSMNTQVPHGVGFIISSTPDYNIFF
jgi:hypothetical protein